MYFSKVNSKKIAEVINELRKKGLYKSGQFSYNNFEQTIKDALKEIRKIQVENNRIFRKKLETEIEWLDLLLCEHLALLFVLDPFFDLKIKSYKGLKK